MTLLALGRVSLARAMLHADALAERYLSPSEQQEISELRVTKRRIERVAGRVAARRALARLGITTTEISIAAVPDGDEAGAPYLLSAAGAPLDVGLSISHGAGSAFAVACRNCDVGIDVERVEPRERAFVEDAFDPNALRVFSRLLGPQASADLVVTVAWCAKEACMKLTRTGMRSPLRSFAPFDASWVGPASSASGTVRRGLRRAVLATEELGVVRASIFAHERLAAVLVWRERSRYSGRLCEPRVA